MALALIVGRYFDCQQKIGSAVQGLQLMVQKWLSVGKETQVAWVIIPLEASLLEIFLFYSFKNTSGKLVAPYFKPKALKEGIKFIGSH